jgi:hypothetical protein
MAGGRIRTPFFNLIQDSFPAHPAAAFFLHTPDYGFLFSVPRWRMPGIDDRQLRSSVSRSEVLSLLGFAPVTATANPRRGSCPLPESASTKSRVFSVKLARNTFQCFPCKAAGNHLDLWAAATKQPRYDAAAGLCRQVGLCRPLDRPIPWLRPQQRRGTRISGNLC